MAGLAAKAAEIPAGRNYQMCDVGKIRAQLDDEDRATLDTWLADPETPGTVIVARLRAHGIAAAAGTVQRHRRKICACDRPR